MGATLDRPGRLEVIGILVACAALLLLLAKLDNDAARRHAQRASAQLAERAASPGQRGRHVETAARTESSGVRRVVLLPAGKWAPAPPAASAAARAPAWLPLIGAVGVLMALGGAFVLGTSRR